MLAAVISVTGMATLATGDARLSDTATEEVASEGLVLAKPLSATGAVAGVGSSAALQATISASLSSVAHAALALAVRVRVRRERTTGRLLGAVLRARF